jgi:glycosyltransferase involved in cell wall biosynthesis
VKILFLSPNQKDRFNWGWQLFRDEIAQQHDVFFVGNGYPDDATTLWNFDIIMLGDAKFLEGYDGLGDNKEPKAMILGDYVDYHPEDGNLYVRRNNDFINKNRVDMVFAKTQYELDVFKRYQLTGFVSKSVLGFVNHYSVDIGVYRNFNLPKTIDVSAIYNDFADWCYPGRKAIKQMISEESAWKTLVGDKITGPVRYDYIGAINRSKIFINKCNIFRLFSWKPLECLACGTFLLTDKPRDSLGLEDGKHLVYFSDLIDLRNKINYYLEHEDEREQIAQQGMEFVRNRHSNKVRVEEMTQKLEGLL